MKKTWTILCAAALAALSLAGCSGEKTQGNILLPSAMPSAAPSAAVPGTPERGDLAGADGVVDGNAARHSDDSPLEDVGNGVRNALDDVGDAARDVGRGAKDAIEGR